MPDTISGPSAKTIYPIPNPGAHTAQQPASEEKWIPTVCGMCYNECTIQVLVRDGVATAVRGLPGAHPNYGKMCAKGKSGIMSLYNPRRISRPLKRTNPEKGLGVDPRWQEISWDEALRTVTEKLVEQRQKNPNGLHIATFDRGAQFPYVPAFTTAFGGRGGGIPHGANLFCGNGVHPVSYLLHGDRDHQPDLTHCQYLIQIGTGYGTGVQQNAMGIARSLAEARVKRGLKMVVVDPVRGSSGSRADEWIPILPGTDAAFCLAVSDVLVNELDIYDAEFLKQYTNAPYLVRQDGHYARDAASGKPMVVSLSIGKPVTYDSIALNDMALEWDGVAGGKPARTSFAIIKEHLKQYSPEYSSEVTSISASTIRRIAKEFGNAAQIGATFRIDGVELPLRPAHVVWWRGISHHQHGMHNGWAAAMLNILVGAVDVPGGYCTVGGTSSDGFPNEGPDGLLIPADELRPMRASIPLKPARLDSKDPDLGNMFPLAPYNGPMAGVTVKDPAKFKIDGGVEFLIIARANPMMTAGDPADTAEVLKRIPFQLSFAQNFEETAQFANIILPDAHYMERLTPLLVNPYLNRASAMKADDEQWSFSTQQPVVQPMNGAKPWVEVLWELAHRMGFAEDFYRSINTLLRLDPDHKLKTDQPHSFEEFADTWIKSWCGDEHGLDYFRKNGFATANKPREVKHRYPRIFHKGRIPLYQEHWLTAGESVKSVIEETNIPWGDMCDYEPLVNYRPCWASAEGGSEFDLYLVNYKVGLLNFSTSIENPHLQELAWSLNDVFNVGIHPILANSYGISNGDTVEIESASGKKVTATVRITHDTHPRCVSVPSALGRTVTSDKGIIGQGIHFNSFIPYRLERIDMLSGALDGCVKIRIRKVNPK